MLAEPSGQGLGQLRDLDPEPPLGQLGERGRVTLALDQGLQHQPARHAGDVTRDAGKFDSGVLQQLLQPLDLPAAFAGHHRPGPGQVAQLPDRRRGHERSPDQPVRAELGQPGRVRDVALATGEVLDLAGVDEHHLEPGVLQQVVERLPVVTGRLHHHQGDLLSNQVLAQRQDRVRRRGPGPHRLDRLTAPPTRDADAHLRVPLRHIHPRTTGVDDFHDRLPPPASNEKVRREEGQEGVSLTLVLMATIHGSRGDPPRHADKRARRHHRGNGDHRVEHERFSASSRPGASHELTEPDRRIFPASRSARAAAARC